MAGIYGSTREDRHFETMLDNHLSAFNDDACRCDVKFTEDYNIININSVNVTKQEIEENKGYCTECGETFNTNEYF